MSLIIARIILIVVVMIGDAIITICSSCMRCTSRSRGRIKATAMVTVRLQSEGGKLR